MSFMVILTFSKGFSQPSLYMPTGNEYDFGKVGPGQLHCKIPLINISEDTLRIIRVNSSCGCTTAPVDKSLLVKGDTALLYVTMSTSMSDGIKSSSIKILVSEKKDSVYIINLKANIVKDIATSTPFFPVPDNVKLNKEVESEIILTNTGNETVKIMPPVYEGNDLIINFNLKSTIELMPNEKFTLKASIIPRAENLTGMVYIPTSSKLMSLISININISIRDLLNQINKK